MDLECDICGESNNYMLMHRLCCGHIYHYECIQRTYECDKDLSLGKKKNTNYCPYCSKETGLLPIVNGIKKPKKYIHYNRHEEKPKITETYCLGTICSGKNKGKICNRKCIVGRKYCKLHKKHITN